MTEILRDHFWACWWMALILGWGLLEVMETALSRWRR